MKKICIISGIFPPDVGGPATFLSQVTRALIKKGYSLNVITYGEHSQVNDYPFPVKRISRNKPALVKILLFIFYILKHGRKADMLFVSDYGVPAMIANFFLRKRVVIRIVEDFAWEYSVRHNLTDDLIDEFQDKKYSLKTELLKKIRSMYIKRADTVIVPSIYLKNLVCKWGVKESKIKVIYNAIKTNDLDLSCSKKEARDRLNLDGKILLSASRLAPWKGVDTVIKALPHLSGDIKFLVIGEGDELPHLKELAKENNVFHRVEFLGFKKHSEVFLYMKAADIFILDSGYEGLAHAILEAMAAQVPIIASNKGGNPELIANGENGLLAPYNDTAALREAVNTILNNPDLAEKFIRNSKEKVKNFQWSRLIKQVLSIIDF